MWLPIYPAPPQTRMDAVKGFKLSVHQPGMLAHPLGQARSVPGRKRHDRQNHEMLAEAEINPAIYWCRENSDE